MTKVTQTKYMLLVKLSMTTTSIEKLSDGAVEDQYTYIMNIITWGKTFSDKTLFSKDYQNIAYVHTSVTLNPKP